MKVALVVIDDGRPEYLAQVVASLEEHLPLEQFATRILVNDTGDYDYACYLGNTYPQFNLQVHHARRRGLGGAVQSAWTAALERPDIEWVWHQEDDVPILADIDLSAMAAVLTDHPDLAQLMLMRPPFNSEEIAAGGVFQLTPNEFTECTDGTNVWTEHARWYGFQPNLAPRHVLERALAEADNFLELGVTEVLKPAGYRFAYWGGINDIPRCDHIGRVRSAGYHW